MSETLPLLRQISRFSSAPLSSFNQRGGSGYMVKKVPFQARPFTGFLPLRGSLMISLAPFNKDAQAGSTDKDMCVFLYTIMCRCRNEPIYKFETMKHVIE